MKHIEWMVQIKFGDKWCDRKNSLDKLRSGAIANYGINSYFGFKKQRIARVVKVFIEDTP